MTEEQKARIRDAANSLQEAMSDVGADFEIEVNRVDATTIEDAEARFQYFIYVTHTNVERI